MTGRRVALVTGAGSGIGRACAVALAEAGFAVVLTGRRPGPLEETADLVRSSGEVLAVPADVTDEASVERLFEAIRAGFERIDLVFNNAGAFAAAADIDDLPVETWRSVVDANLTATFLVAREAVRLMKSQRPRGGRIINNASISAETPRPMSAAYTASKHAITGLTKSISLDGRAFDIACGQINIGNAVTEMTESMAQGARQADGSFAPEPRMDVEHVARAVVFMATLPLEANVQSMTILATKMPYVGRG